MNQPPLASSTAAASANPAPGRSTWRAARVRARQARPNATASSPAQSASTTGVSVVDSKPRAPTKPASVTVAGHDRPEPCAARSSTTTASAYTNVNEGIQMSGSVENTCQNGDGQ